MKKFKNSKLLVLGANAETIPIIKRAQQMGVYVTVTDHIYDSPAKKVADAFWDINGKDVAILNKRVIEQKIDGILLGVADPLVPYYVRLCDLTKLPCLIDQKNIDFFTNKKVFKEICEKEGIFVSKTYYTGSDFNKLKIEELEFPVIVKPVIGRGGKGVSLCRNLKELAECFEYAKKSSDNNEAIVEEYIESSDIGANYIICDGIPRLLTLADRQVLNKNSNISPVTYGNKYPSIWGKKYLEGLNEKFYRLFRNLKINNGLFNIQIFVSNGMFFPYDPDCIINGELSSPVYPEIAGVDVIGACINFALTGKLNIEEYTTLESVKDVSRFYASIWILLKPGKIERIEGKECLDQCGNHINYIWRLNIGDVITEDMFQTEKSTLARIWIVSGSQKELSDYTVFIRNSIKVYDQSGNNMIY